MKTKKIKFKTLITIATVAAVMFSCSGLTGVVAKAENASEKVSGTTYYVSSSQGSDENVGTSADKPWKTFKNVGSLVLSAGDKVLLKRGDEFHERLSVTGNGTADDYVEIGAYGEGEKPIISQTNDDGDVAVLLNDFYADKNGDAVTCPIKYVRIRDLRIENTAMGVYVRLIATANTSLIAPETQSKYVEVLDCEFQNVQNDALHEVNKTVDEAEAGYDGFSLAASDAINKIYNKKITEVHGRPRGDLPIIENGKYKPTGGGSFEYFFASCVLVGGKKNTVRPENIDEASTAFECLTVKNCVMTDVVSGVMCYFYNFNGTSGDNGYRQAFKNVRIENVTATGVAPSVVGFSCVDGGAVLKGDSMVPSPEGWGLIKNVRVIHGALDRENNVPLGTTDVIIESCKNLLFSECEFNGSKNHDNCDGCGFDFEGGNHNVEVSDSVLSYNDGGAFLIMNNGSGAHKNLFIKNNLIYANLQNAYHQYNNRNNGIDCRYIAIYNEGNENIVISGNAVHMQRLTTMGAEIVFIGPKTAEEAGYKLIYNEITYYEDGAYFKQYSQYRELTAGKGSIVIDDADISLGRYNALLLSVRGTKVASGKMQATYLDGEKSEKVKFTAENGYIEIGNISAYKSVKPIKSLSIESETIKEGAAVSAEFFILPEVKARVISNVEIELLLLTEGMAFARDLQANNFGLCNLFTRKKVVAAKRTFLNKAVITLDGEMTEKEAENVSLKGAILVYGEAFADSAGRVIAGEDLNGKPNEYLTAYLKSLRLVQKPSKLTYSKGENLNLNGAKLAAVYADGREADMNVSKAFVSGYDGLKTGSVLVGLQYAGKYCYFRVNVTDDKPSESGGQGCGGAINDGGAVGALIVAFAAIVAVGRKKKDK